MLSPHLWYLAFGALDDYYEAISRINNVDTAWTNSDNLEFAGRVYKVSGYADHPLFESTAFDWGLLDLYEQRGAPDDCEKVDGNWVCN